MTTYEARIEAHQTATGVKPDYNLLHRTMSSISFIQEYVTKQGVRHELPGVYRRYLAMSSIEDTEHQLRSTLEGLPFKTSYELFQVVNSRKGECDPTPSSGFGTLFGLKV